MAVVSQQSRSLSTLRSGKVRHCELSFKVCDFLVLRVDLIRAHLVKNTLSVRSLICDNITDTIRQSRAVSAVLGKYRRCKISRSKTVITANCVIV